jgi:hypothetical protein
VRNVRRRRVSVYRYHSACHKTLPLKITYFVNNSCLPPRLVFVRKQRGPFKTRFFVACPELAEGFFPVKPLIYAGFWALDVKIQPTMFLKAYLYTIFEPTNQPNFSDTLHA